jgi:hypothetical protein
MLALHSTNYSALSVTQSFWVTVLPPVINNPPLITAVSNQQMIAGATLVQPVEAEDPAQPPQRLWFSLLTSPPGATINTTNGDIAWRPTMAQAGTSNLFTVTVTENGWWTNVSPLADAYVRDGIYSNANYGADASLFVKASATAGQARESYLRFPVAPLPGSLASATLELTPLSTSLPGTHAAALLTNDAWLENAITWSNRPSSGAPLATWLPQTGVRTSAAVNLAAQEAMNSDQLLSLRVYATNTTADGLVQYGSREGVADQAPALVLYSTNFSALSATQSFWVAVRLPAAPQITAAGWSHGQFRLHIAGDAGPDYRMVASTNLRDWTLVETVTPGSLPMLWTDPDTNPWSQRYYRIELGP